MIEIKLNVAAGSIEHHKLIAFLYDNLYEFSSTPNGSKPIVSGALDADSNSLLNSVVYIFGRMYGKDKEFDENTVGGRLIEDIKLKLANDH